ncbi:MAG: TonB-dependent receptor, partial [Candidatus Cloacimonetes bacterium]|nr:TonB-dependent receptor [Candidatus Cloacimonadota bacterium]
AEYGRYMSGVVNWTTRSGGSDYKVTAEMESELGDTKHNYGDLVYGLGISGPIIPGNTNHRFMVAAESFATDDLSPSFVDNGPKNNAGSEYLSAAAKLTSNFSESMRMDLGFLMSNEDWNEYRHSYYFNSDHMPYYEDRNTAIYGRFNYAVNKDINGTFTAGYTDVSRFRGDNMFKDNLLAYGTDNLPTYPTAALFWDPDRMFRNFMKRRTESLSWRLDLQMLFEPSLASLLTSDADELAELQSRHDLRFGVDGQMYTVRYYEHFFPNNVQSDGAGNYNANAFVDANYFGYDRLGEETDSGGDSTGPREPTVFGLYVQDKVSLSYGIRLDLGLRLDVLNPNTRKIKDLTSPLGNDGVFSLANDTEDTQSFKIWSPRLGVSFPASENTTFHFNYGKYAQFPSFYSYYIGYEYYDYYINNSPYHTVLGNPNLEPIKLTSFEFGIDHALGDYASVAFSAYYKDIKDYVNSQNLSAVPSSYSTYFNMDRAVTKGFEFEYRLQPYKRFSGVVNYTLSWANGTGSSNDSNDRVSHTAGEVPKYTNPLVFDRRHNLAGLLSYAFAKGDGPRLADYPVLENTVFGVQLNANSGRPYTKRNVYNEVTLGSTFPENERSINASYMDWNYQLDLQLTRKFAFGRVGLELSARVENLLDTENQVAVWEGSGDAGTTYWLGTNEGLAWQQNNAGAISEYDGMTGPDAYRFREDDPNNWSSPRRVFFGLTVTY